MAAITSGACRVAFASDFFNTFTFVVRPELAEIPRYNVALLGSRSVIYKISQVSEAP
jgi:hypothetical protein